MGGNGYLMASGVASLAQDYVWQTTAEGDFVVMLLQLAKFLLKAYASAKQGEEISGKLPKFSETGFQELVCDT